MATATSTPDLKDSHLRSVLKGVTWRFIATGTTAGISYLVTGSIGTALAIGGIEFFAKLLLYYLHERLWLAIPLGTIRKLYPIHCKQD